MLLAIQIQSMLYAFLMGIVYGITFSLKQYISMYSKNEIRKACVDILFHMLFVCVLYYGLYTLNKGISNIYLGLLFLLGIYFYYVFYYEVFLTFYTWTCHKIYPYYKKTYLLILRKYSIICSGKVKERRHGKKKSRKKKNVKS